MSCVCAGENLVPEPQVQVQTTSQGEGHGGAERTEPGENLRLTFNPLIRVYFLTYEHTTVYSIEIIIVIVHTLILLSLQRKYPF